MLFFYEGCSKIPCIYEIRNVQSNRRYIGQTIRPKDRWTRGHKQSLLRNVHRNKYLQNDFNKCFQQLGHTDFLEFHILETLPDSTQTTRSEKEQFWIKRQKKHFELYNMIDVCNQNYIHKEETKIKISLAKKQYYSTPEGRNLIIKLAEHKYGKSYEELYGSDKALEIRKKISDYKLIEKNKPEVKENLRKLLSGITEIERYGVEKAALIKEKKSKARKGKYVGANSPNYKKISDIRLISPDGKIYTCISGIKEFSSIHNLAPNHLSELLSGKRKSHKGWTLEQVI
jgi:hypothetical protein